jgi:hypothetical protein
MVKLIQNISSTNDGEQYKDNKNNNSIANYFKANKHTLLDLAEKNYENLTEALTDNVVGSAVTASLSNPTLSLPQSSSMFPGYRNKVIPTE